MNVHDSEKISGVLSQEGYCPSHNPKDSDIIIFNTCSIRHKAEQKFFSDLGRIKTLKKRKPDLKIAVAGCIAQQQGKEIFKRAPYVDFVFGPQNIHKLNDFLKGGSLVTANEDNPLIAETDLHVSRMTKGRAWVSIMYGCNNFCSYCVVPYTRGRERSRPSENIIREINGLAEKGYKEVTLLGQNVNSYKSDIDFPVLLQKINAIPGIERIRFVTSHPRDLSHALIIAMSNLEKVCEHIHLPLQSGSNRILSHMNRGYLYNDYLRKIDSLRKIIKDISITTDIIAGFPGEKDDDHLKTIGALKEIEFDGVFAFKFSLRSGTAAASMDDQVEEEIRSQRLSEILALQDSITLKINKKLENTMQEILVEGDSDSDKDVLTGRARSNKIVNFKGHKSCCGSIINVKIVQAKKHSLCGELV